MSKPLSISQLEDLLKQTKLNFGHPDSIQLRDAFEVARIAERLKKLGLQCPNCYDELEVADVNIKDSIVIWSAEFDCHEEITTDLEGNFI